MANNTASKPKTTILIMLIGLVTYNVALFALCGFEDHGATFWVSYVFMLIAFASTGVSGYMLSQKTEMPKDWLLGYPILRHCAIYVGLEAIASIVFMYLDYENDCEWGIALAVQTVLLALHLVMILSSFKSKEKVEEVQTNVKTKTSRMKFLQVDVEMVAQRAANPAVKSAYTKLAEQVRYSDPVSNDLLADTENQIAYLIEQAKTSIMMNNDDNALAICRQATLLLEERNKKCKMLK